MLLVSCDCGEQQGKAARHVLTCRGSMPSAATIPWHLLGEPLLRSHTALTAFGTAIAFLQAFAQLTAMLFLWNIQGN